MGKIYLPITNDCFDPSRYRDELVAATGHRMAKNWVRHELDSGLNEQKVTAITKATVAICTRNRPDDLKRCLDALMQLADDGQEFLVVDNSPSNDDTRMIVAQYPKVRYVRESLKGLNIARNRALREAAHEIVAFTDDDAVPDRQWLRCIVRNFQNPLVQCVTGLTMPLELETEAQEAFENYSPFSKGFDRLVHSMQTRNPLSAGQVGAGANMALRKTVLQHVGLFDEALDAGTPTESGGDHEFFARILLAGYEIVYDPAALSWHRHRRSWKETRQAIRGYGIGVYSFWLRTLIEEKEWQIIHFPIQWFLDSQLKTLVRSVLRLPGFHPADLILAELKGCIIAPWKYYLSRRQLKRKLDLA